MIKRLAAVTAKWLLQAGAISASDVELYEYSIYGFLFTLCPLGLVLIISMFLHMVVEGILLIIPFILIRKFCGGFHFQSPAFCGIVSTLVLTAFLCLCFNRNTVISRLFGACNHKKYNQSYHITQEAVRQEKKGGFFAWIAGREAKK